MEKKSIQKEVGKEKNGTHSKVRLAKAQNRT